MRYLMVIRADQDRTRAWEQLTPQEQERDAEPVQQWYETNAAAGRIQAGEELAWPRDRIAVARSPGGHVVEHVAETGDRVLAAVMTIEVESTEAAIALAASWPDLRAPGDRIDLFPIRTYDQP